MAGSYRPQKDRIGTADSAAPQTGRMGKRRRKGEGDRKGRKDRIMALTAHPPTQDLINLVGTLGGTWHGRTEMCLCHAHADKNPSLALRQGARGSLVTCFDGCARWDVLRELARVTVGAQYGYERSEERHVGKDR